MIEIIVDGKMAKERLFDTYHDIVKEYITPKNNEIRKYCKFLKRYYPNHNKEVNYIEYFFVMELERNYESFLFEFPDDYPEDAFYFKLKYY